MKFMVKDFNKIFQQQSSKQIHRKFIKKKTSMTHLPISSDAAIPDPITPVPTTPTTCTSEISELF